MRVTHLVRREDMARPCNNRSVWAVLPAAAEQAPGPGRHPLFSGVACAGSNAVHSEGAEEATAQVQP